MSESKEAQIDKALKEFNSLSAELEETTRLHMELHSQDYEVAKLCTILDQMRIETDTIREVLFHSTPCSEADYFKYRNRLMLGAINHYKDQIVTTAGITQDQLTETMETDLDEDSDNI